ncbi:MAG: hypothetical protein PWP06_1152 [Candidatus Marinimicrobia bacterium]|nr:hypothetical protein [Candidatus Neomarinimicrobiota bacterium]
MWFFRIFLCFVIFVTMLQAQDDFDALFGIEEEDLLFSEDTTTAGEEPVDDLDLLLQGETVESADDLFLFPDEVVDKPLEQTEQPVEAVPAQSKEIQTGEKRSFIVSVGAVSPTLASVDLMTWNSSVDFRMSTRLPILLFKKVHAGVDISTFRFENSLPQGGLYSGVAAFLSFERPFHPGMLGVGAGIIKDAPGFYLEQSYGLTKGKRFPIQAGARVIFTSDILGNGWGNWLELGFRMGFRVF